MDCNNTITFIKEWNRMCDSYDSCSYECPLYKPSYSEICEDWITNENHIEEAIEIVQKWSDEQFIEWRPVDGYEDRYEVSNTGIVRSVDRIICRKDGFTSERKGTATSYG